jgi:hypothetical protein
MRKDSNKGGGYGNPPHHSRWKPGQSGNPKGRPKKDMSLATISVEHMREMLISAGLQPIEFNEKGKKKTAPKLHVILMQLSNKAAGGDIRAAKLFLEMMKVATTENDKMRHEWIYAWTTLKAEMLDVQNKKGSLAFYYTMRKYYGFKNDMRMVEGPHKWPYEDEEPKTTEDWALFVTRYEDLKSGRINTAPWPLNYPSNSPPDQ